jgi:hypothetical protein
VRRVSPWQDQSSSGLSPTAPEQYTRTPVLAAILDAVKSRSGHFLRRIATSAQYVTDLGQVSARRPRQLHVGLDLKLSGEGSRAFARDVGRLQASSKSKGGLVLRTHPQAGQAPPRKFKLAAPWSADAPAPMLEHAVPPRPPRCMIESTRYRRSCGLSATVVTGNPHAYERAKLTISPSAQVSRSVQGSQLTAEPRQNPRDAHHQPPRHQRRHVGC